MAQTAGKLRSNLLAVYIEEVIDEAGAAVDSGLSITPAANTYVAIGCSNNATLSLTRETIDATKKENDGARVILPAGETFQMTCEGFVAFSNTNAAGNTLYDSVDLFTIWKEKHKVTLAWQTDNAGDIAYRGDAYLTSIEQNAGTNDVATYSLTFEGTGSITKHTIASETIHNV